MEKGLTKGKIQYQYNIFLHYRCIAKSWHCDMESDCDGAEDEQGCGKSDFRLACNKMCTTCAKAQRNQTIFSSTGPRPAGLLS